MAGFSAGAEVAASAGVPLEAAVVLRPPGEGLLKRPDQQTNVQCIPILQRSNCACGHLYNDIGFNKYVGCENSINFNVF